MNRVTEWECRIAELMLIRGGLAIVWSHRDRAACVSILRAYSTRRDSSLYRQRPSARRAFRRIAR